jgi:hypothetical protein
VGRIKLASKGCVDIVHEKVSDEADNEAALSLIIPNASQSSWCPWMISLKGHEGLTGVGELRGAPGMQEKILYVSGPMTL